MTVSFDGRVAIVTGAGNGLGRSYALELARRGCRVLVNDLGGSTSGEGADAAAANQVVAEIRAAGGEAISNLGSVADYDNGQRMVEQCLDEWGRLDIVICNAGILRDKSFHNLEPKDWDAIFDVHVKGAYNVLRAAWPVFRDRGYGRAILTSSASGVWGYFGQANYGAAKTSMIGFMNVLKQEGLKYNTCVNTLIPVAGTRLTATVWEPARVEAFKPEHVTPAVVYLASEACTDTGLIIEAGAGNFNRVALTKGPGAHSDQDAPVSVEWVQEHWNEITALDGTMRLMWSGRETLDEFMAARA